MVISPRNWLKIHAERTVQPEVASEQASLDKPRSVLPALLVENASTSQQAVPNAETAAEATSKPAGRR